MPMQLVTPYMVPRSKLELLRAHTWDLVSTELSMAPVSVFQVLMQRSALPPPLASRLDWKGHHASACQVQRPKCQQIADCQTSSMNTAVTLD